MKTFREISKINDNLIRNGTSIQPMCFMLDKGKVLVTIGMAYGNSRKKEIIREQIKKYVLENGIKAYILIQDSLMTKIDKKTGKHETIDVIMRTIFMPNDQYLEIVQYKNKKIIKKTIMTNDKDFKFRSEWNVWNNTEIKDYNNEEYQKIKKENPERYKEVA